MSGLGSGVDADHARDVVSTLISSDVWRLLVEERGWTLDEYEHWLDRAIAAAILDAGEASMR